MMGVDGIQFVRSLPTQACDSVNKVPITGFSLLNHTGQKFLQMLIKILISLLDCLRT